MLKQAARITVQLVGAALAVGGAYVVYLAGRELYGAVTASRLAPITLAPTLLMLACGAVPLPMAYRLLSAYDEASVRDLCTLLAVMAALFLCANQQDLGLVFTAVHLRGQERDAALLALLAGGPLLLRHLLIRLLLRFT